MRVRLFGEITKTEKQDDGTLIVSGVASSEVPDSDGEIVTAAAMKAALPDYMKFGAVREMHGNIAAGTAISASVQADGKTAFEALVVDAGSVKKVETGVLKGFSIGGRVPKGGRNADNPKLIEKLNLTEISLVDRPSNPAAVISLVKFDGKPLKKGLYQLSWAADLLSSLSCLQKDTEWEKEFEGDDSAIPARLKALVSELAEVVTALCAEEVSELTAAAAAQGVLAMTEQQLADLVAKTVSAAIPAAVEAAVAKAMKTADPVGDPPPDKPVVKAADAPAKPRITLDETADKIAKLESGQDELKKSNDLLVKENADLKAAAGAKGVLKVVAVDKSADVAKAAGATDDEPKTTADAIRKVHKAGPSPYFGSL